MDLVYATAVSSTATGTLAYSPTFTIPNLAALGGQQFFDQAVFLDPIANS